MWSQRKWKPKQTFNWAQRTLPTSAGTTWSRDFSVKSHRYYSQRYTWRALTNEGFFLKFCISGQTHTTELSNFTSQVSSGYCHPWTGKLNHQSIRWAKCTDLVFTTRYVTAQIFFIFSAPFYNILRPKFWPFSRVKNLQPQQSLSTSCHRSLKRHNSTQVPLLLTSQVSEFVQVDLQNLAWLKIGLKDIE